MLAIRGQLAKSYRYSIKPWAYPSFRPFTQTAFRLDNSQEGLSHREEQTQAVQEDTHFNSKEAKDEHRQTKNLQQSPKATSTCSPGPNPTSQWTETNNEGTKYTDEESSQWLTIKQYQYPYKREYHSVLHWDHMTCMEYSPIIQCRCHA
jgi:hypothetical protein